jgi:hypothetical protein
MPKHAKKSHKKVKPSTRAKLRKAANKRPRRANGRFKSK